MSDGSPLPVTMAEGDLAPSSGHHEQPHSHVHTLTHIHIMKNNTLRKTKAQRSTVTWSVTELLSGRDWIETWKPGTKSKHMGALAHSLRATAVG